MTRPLFLALTAFALFGCASAPQPARVDASPAAAPPTAVAEDGTALPNTARLGRSGGGEHRSAMTQFRTCSCRAR